MRKWVPYPWVMLVMMPFLVLVLVVVVGVVLVVILLVILLVMIGVVVVAVMVVVVVVLVIILVVVGVVVIIVVVVTKLMKIVWYCDVDGAVSRNREKMVMLATTVAVVDPAVVDLALKTCFRELRPT